MNTTTNRPCIAWISESVGSGGYVRSGSEVGDIKKDSSKTSLSTLPAACAF